MILFFMIFFRAFSAPHAFALPLEVPCYPDNPPPTYHSGASQNVGLRNCSIVIPDLVSMIKQSLATRIEAYYHGCDVTGSGTGATPPPAPFAIPSPFPAGCGEAVAAFSGICNGATVSFPKPVCDPYADIDMASFGIPGCSPEYGAGSNNNYGQGCGQYMQMSTSISSKQCYVHGNISGVYGELESAYTLGMMIHALSYNWISLQAEIETGTMDVSSLVGQELALGITQGLQTNSSPYVKDLTWGATNGVVNQANIGDVDMSESTYRTGQDTGRDLRYNANLFVSSTLDNALRHNMEMMFAQTATIEVFNRAWGGITGFNSVMAGLAPNQIIPKMHFTKNSCGSGNAQSQYNSLFPAQFYNAANAAWPGLPALP